MSIIASVKNKKEKISIMKVYDKRYFYYIYACFFVYLMTIAIKMCYSAQMVSIMEDFNASKSEISKGLTVYYFIYAVAQIVLAPQVKRMNMRNFLVVASLLSAVSFGCVFFCTSLGQIWVILALNGILQSGIYGGIMSLFGKYLPDGISEYVSNVLSLGLPLGTALTYGASALFVACFSWRYTFLFFAIMFILSVFVFILAERRVKIILHETVKSKVPEKKERIVPKKKSGGMLIFYITIISLLVSIIYYGMTNWVPNLLKEVHGMPAQYSILVTILIPFSMIPGPILATRSCEKHKNYFGVGAVFCVISLVLSLALFFLYSANIVTAILLSAASLLFLRGLLNMVCTYVPLILKKSYEAGKLSMISNALASFGAGIAPFVTGLIMDKNGSANWRGYYIFILAFVAASSIVLFFASRYLKKTQKKESDIEE